MSLSSHLTLKMPGSDTPITSPSNHSESNCFLILTPIKSTSTTSSPPEFVGVGEFDCGVCCGVDCERDCGVDCGVVVSLGGVKCGGVVVSLGGGVGGGVDDWEESNKSRPRLRDLS